MNTNKKWLLIIFICVLLAFTYPFVFKAKEPKVFINGKSISVEIADSEKERRQGLSGRDSLDSNKGMLFVFPTTDFHSFWMKDTKIPLDIIWIEENTSKPKTGKIVEMVTLDPEVDPENIPNHTPKTPAKYVLEVNAGFVEENGLKVGDEVRLQV